MKAGEKFIVNDVEYIAELQEPDGVCNGCVAHTNSELCDKMPFCFEYDDDDNSKKLIFKEIK